MSRILITGASGFIGKALARSCAERSHLVFGIGSNGTGGIPFSDYRTVRLPDPTVDQMIRSWQPDLVYHCAGAADPTNSLRDPQCDFDASVPVVFELLERMRRHRREARFVFLSSAAVYGQPASLPVAESAAIAPLSPYGYHKSLCESLCREYAELYGMSTTSARIFSAYGPGLKRQIVWDAISKFHRGGPVEFFGTGNESRDFIFIDDLVAALTCIGEASDGGFRVWNVGSGVETTIADLVGAVAACPDLSADTWSFTGVKDAAAPSNWRADIGSLAGLGFAAATPFCEGVKRTVSWALAELRGTRR